MKQQPELNIPLLQAKIVQGITTIHNNINQGQQQCVLFLGDSGVGKTTLLSYLIGQQLHVEQIGLKPCLVGTGWGAARGLRIGHGKCSETAAPVKIIHESMVIYDCPGFNDNNSCESDIANSFYYQRLASLHDCTKIVLVIDESYLTDRESVKLQALVGKISQAYGDLDRIRECTLLVVNRCGDGVTEEDVSRQMGKVAVVEGLFTRQQRSYLQFLVENGNVFVFGQPKRTSIGSTINTDRKQQLLTKIRQLPYLPQTEINNIISQSSKLAIRDYMDGLTQRTTHKITQLFDKFTAKIKDSRTGLFQIKQQIMRAYQGTGRRGDVGALEDFCIQRRIPTQDVISVSQDLQIAEFFSRFYCKQKIQAYYLCIDGLINSRLSVLLQQVTTRIQRQRQQAERHTRIARLHQQQQVMQKLHRSQSQQNIKAVLKAKQQVFNELSSNVQVRNYVLASRNKFASPLMEDLYRKIKETEQNVKEISAGARKLQYRAKFMQEKMGDKEN